MPANELLFQNGLVFCVALISALGGVGNGMGRVFGALLRSDPFIVFEHDNKTHVDTRSQFFSKEFKVQRDNNTYPGAAQKGKLTHHKGTIVILRGTFPPYLTTMVESHGVNMICEVMKAQAIVVSGGCTFVNSLFASPPNWKMDEYVDHSAAAIRDLCRAKPIDDENGWN